MEITSFTLGGEIVKYVTNCLIRPTSSLLGASLLVKSKTVDILASLG